MTDRAPSPIAEPRSYWHATAAPPVPTDPLPAGSDVVVVGGGLLGCWTAYWLARGGTAVTLIERTAISWGATGRNGGFLVTGTAEGYGGTVAQVGRDQARELWRLAEDGRQMAVDLIADEAIDCDFRTPGTLSLTLTSEALAGTQRNVAMMREDGIPGEVLDRQGVQDLIKTPLGPEITGGAYAADGGQLHSARYLAGVAAAARRHGAIMCQAAVTALVPEGNGTRVETSAGPIHANRVIVALNAWCDELVPGVAGVVVPVRGQILSYAPGPEVFPTGAGTDVTPTGEYWQQTPDGAIVIGGCRADAPGSDVGVREMVPTPDVIAKIEAVLPRLFPQLTDLRVAERWAGLMAFTSDYLPVADAAPDLPGVWVTGGYSGHGMPYGPRVGQLLAEAAVTGRTPDALAPLRLTRPSLRPLVQTT